ncbi:MAG: hypothetical protein SVX43_17080, partial [Cyanobacteriota bacterium]|nr:hypothetical protein [Cyanobacteriota bacterium]
MVKTPRDTSSPPGNPPLPPEATLPTMYDLPSEELAQEATPLDNPPLPPEATLPTMYDLPSEDPEEPGLPDEFHLHQPNFLRQTCRSPLYAPDWMFIG